MEAIGLTGIGLVAGVGLILLVPPVRREFARMGQEMSEGAREIWEEAKQHAGLIAGVGTLAALGATAAAVAPEAPAAAGAATAAGAALTIPAAIEALDAADTVRGWVDDLVGRDHPERTKH